MKFLKINELKYITIEILRLNHNYGKSYIINKLFESYYETNKKDLLTKDFNHIDFFELVLESEKFWRNFGEILMEKIDLKDVTFIIPFRCDSQDRLENIELIVDYLTYNFNTTIFILENSFVSILGNHPLVSNPMVHYIWEQSDSTTFHRTKILNDMLSKVKTKFVANYDTDVLFPVHSYVETVEALRSGEVFVFPYQGIFYEVPRQFIPDIREKMEVSCVNLNQCGINHPSSVGGAMFLNTDIYKKVGGECEAFLDWGYEDNFRVNLFSKMGYNIARVGNYLYHMQHWRGKSSGPNHETYNNNVTQFYNTVNMTRTQLIDFVNSYNRFKE